MLSQNVSIHTPVPNLTFLSLSTFNYTYKQLQLTYSSNKEGSRSPAQVSEKFLPDATVGFHPTLESKDLPRIPLTSAPTL